jgi:hypothetical protein
MRLWRAIRSFFAVLFDSRFAAEVERLLRSEGSDQVVRSSERAVVAEKSPAVAVVPTRSDAITLLATLQREARFVDIVKEPLGEYSDAQIGAAARDVLRDCAVVLDRLFLLQPLVHDEEGAQLETPVDFDPGRYRLTGKVTGNPPFKGRLVHHGWHAARCELPQWSGSSQSRMVVAPIELDVQG